MDKMVGQLNSGACVSVVREMTGTLSPRNILEADYGTEYGFLKEMRRLASPEFGFMVPTSFKGAEKFDDGDTYIPMSDISETSDQPSVVRILEYGSLHHEKPTVYIALGFQGSATWTDIILSSDYDIDPWVISSGERMLPCLGLADVTCDTSAGGPWGWLPLGGQLVFLEGTHEGEETLRALLSVEPPSFLSCSLTPNSYTSHIFRLMRLLNTETLILGEFYTNIPPYAILSHTWEKEEITFQDIQNLEAAKRKAGYAKIENACQRARQYDFEWIWIDSCCINKESSAELSEAINSMYQYYADAVVCYVYLSGVSAEYHPRDLKSSFSKSRWFTRGWTLQELLAPKYVVFLDEKWVKIGTRWTLRDVVSAITSIPVEVFEGRDVEGYSVAQRMSWAALRKTTRPEDEAYCLMGIFGVSMPPIYGEGGEKAFMRLQQEIIKISDDRSIFAWVASESSHNNERGLLARSPYEHRFSGQVKPSNSDLSGLEYTSYSFGNNGLRIHLPLIPSYSVPGSSGVGNESMNSEIFLASLHCQSESNGGDISIYLQKTFGQRYVRIQADMLVIRSSESSSSRPELLQELTVKEPPISRATREHAYIMRFNFRWLPSAQHFSIAKPLSTITLPYSYFVDRHKLKSAPLEYRSSTAHESFSVHINYWFLQFHNVYRRIDGHQHNLDSDPVDTLLGQLRDDSYLSLSGEMTGKESLQIVEIDCISKGKAHYDFLAQTLRTPDLAFMVPAQYLGYDLREVFPPDIFMKRFQEEAYVTVPDTDTAASTECIPFRVLSYCFGVEPEFYIVLGFQGSDPWVDTCEDYVRGLTIEDVWRSYLSDRLGRAVGSRGHTSRTKCQSSVTVDIFGLPMLASVERRTDALHLCPHFLRLEGVTNAS
ncbi:hypothetical protein D9758_013156 [Tetrapyrgos nigripes]|uniref:Heterokaryon incompatibility domain-containing protein n=1 Tax=Tetrapyrgos nigripes TaxID=182062 RepID=A0A8H5CF43_9AGAR|nr:hypothetical protein D9758_013156 [Tetrapyrgos nigripes]